VVPKAHYETLGDLPKALIAPYFTAVQLLARAVERGMGADGSFVAINNHISQSVPHLHAHVVPRWTKDGLFARGFIWKRQPYESQESIVTVQHAIQSAVVQLQSR
jgi:histidine triad (HIT) family protein